MEDYQSIFNVPDTDSLWQCAGLESKLVLKRLLASSSLFSMTLVVLIVTVYWYRNIVKNYRVVIIYFMMPSWPGHS